MLPGKHYHAEELVQIGWRRKWLLVLPSVVGALAVTAVSMTIPNRYRSETLILVVPQRIPESYVRSTVTSRIEDRLRSITQQILSRTRLERIIHDLNPYPEWVGKRPMEEIVTAMRRDIHVETVRDDAFRVSFQSSNPVVAMRTTERLASLFIDENLKDREVLAEGTNAFLENELENARRQLVEHEKKLEAFRLRYAGELPSQVDSNLQTMQNTQMQLQAVAGTLDRDRDRRLVLERLVAETGPRRTPAAPVATGAADALAAARATLTDLTERLKPEHPDVEHWQRVVADLERRAAAERGAAQTVDPEEVADDAARANRLGEARLELATLDRRIRQGEAEQQRLRSVMAECQRRIDAAPKRESDQIALSRDYETLQQVYRTLLAKREDSRMSANLERRQVGEQFKVLDPAQLPERPFAPDRPRMALFGAFFGLCIGLGLSTLLEFHDSRLRTDDDVVTSLGLPVIAMIPTMVTAIDVHRTKWRRLAAIGAAVLVLLLGVGAVWGVTR